jgi:hypothetical protein
MMSTRRVPRRFIFGSRQSHRARPPSRAFPKTARTGRWLRQRCNRGEWYAHGPIQSLLRLRSAPYIDSLSRVFSLYPHFEQLCARLDDFFFPLSLAGLGKYVWSLLLFSTEPLLRFRSTRCFLIPFIIHHGRHFQNQHNNDSGQVDRHNFILCIDRVDSAGPEQQQQQLVCSSPSGSWASSFGSNKQSDQCRTDAVHGRLVC